MVSCIFGVMEKITKDEIDNVITEILIKDGADGHCDGHEIITDFIVAILEGNYKEWVENYNKKWTVIIVSW